MSELDVDTIRGDFPVLEARENEMPLVYLDNACMTLKPETVVEAMNEYYHGFPACGGRAVHSLSNEVTIRYEIAREQVQSYLGARDHREVVFTRNATEALNLVARSIPWEKGDLVIGSDREHNSNLIPWLWLARSQRLRYKVTPSRANGWEFDLEAFKELMEQRPRLVSMVLTSNLDGYTLPVREIIECAHDQGALVLLDGAQAAPHNPMDVTKLGVDLLAISLHKMCGPSGVGVLWGRYELLANHLNPFILGGDTVTRTTYEDFTLLDPPQKFEAGLQNYAGVIGAGVAAEYVDRMGREAIHDHEVQLNRRLSKALEAFDTIEILGPPDPEQRGGICSFNMEGMDSHMVAMTLDDIGNIMIRSGMHCVHSWFNAHNINGCARASFYMYNTAAEVDLLVEKLHEISG